MDRRDRDRDIEIAGAWRACFEKTLEFFAEDELSDVTIEKFGEVAARFSEADSMEGPLDDDGNVLPMPATDICTAYDLRREWQAALEAYMEKLERVRAKLSTHWSERNLA
jgi:hypothetical protein